MNKKKKKTLDQTQFYFLIKNALQPLDYNERALASMLGYSIITTLAEFSTNTGSEIEQRYEEIKELRKSFNTLIQKLKQGEGLNYESELAEKAIELLNLPEQEVKSYFLNPLLSKVTISNYARRLESLGLNLYEKTVRESIPPYGVKAALELDINNLEESINEMTR